MCIRDSYPKADITVGGFETTDRRDFYDLAIGNVPFGQYQVNDKAYSKLNFSIHNYFFAKSLDQVRPGGCLLYTSRKQLRLYCQLESGQGTERAESQFGDCLLYTSRCV